MSARWRSFAEGVNVEKNDPCYSYNLFLLILPQFIINNNLYSHFCHILLFYYIILFIIAHITLFLFSYYLYRHNYGSFLYLYSYPR